jgi:succinyl-CoA synthetase alpha subunit
MIGKRTTPSVAGIIYPFGGQFVSKMYWGTSETLLPVYQEVDKACEKHPEVDTVSTSRVLATGLVVENT